jgi:hypothetical protein
MLLQQVLQALQALQVQQATATQLTTASGSAPSYSARAWVNFNGTGTVAIRASANISSITDFNTGDYRANFTTALPNNNYAFGFGVGTNDRTIRAYDPSTWLTTSFRFFNWTQLLS